MGWDEATEVAVDNLLEIEARRKALAENTTKPYEEWALEHADIQIEELAAEVVRLRAQLADWQQEWRAVDATTGEVIHVYSSEPIWGDPVENVRFETRRVEPWVEMPEAMIEWGKKRQASRVVFTEHVRDPHATGCLHDHEEES